MNSSDRPKQFDTETTVRPIIGDQEEIPSESIEQQAIAYAVNHPDAPVEQIMEMFGLQIQSKIEGLSSPKFNTAKIGGFDNPDFFHGKTTDSVLKPKPNIDKPSDAIVAKVRKKFATIKNEFEVYEKNPHMQAPGNISRMLSNIRTFLGVENLDIYFPEYMKAVIHYEKKLNSKLLLLRLRDIFEDLKNLDYSSINEARHKISELIQLNSLSQEEIDEITIIKSFIEFIGEAQQEDFEMEKCLTDIETILRENDSDIMKISDEELKRFAQVLVRFNSFNKKRYKFEHKTPIRISTIKALKVYWELFEAVLFCEVDKKIPVTLENRENIFARYSKIKVFAEIYPFSEDTRLLNIMTELEDLLREMDKKLSEKYTNAIKILELIYVEKKPIASSDKTKKIVAAAVETVFLSSEAKNELYQRMEKTHMSYEMGIFQMNDINEILRYTFMLLGWI